MHLRQVSTPHFSGLIISSALGVKASWGGTSWLEAQASPRGSISGMITSSVPLRSLLISSLLSLPISVSLSRFCLGQWMSHRGQKRYYFQASKVCRNSEHSRFRTVTVLRQDGKLDRLERLTLGWHETLDFGRISCPSPNCARSVCMNNVDYAGHLLCFWESEILACARQRVPCGPPPVKALGTESLMSCIGRQHFTHAAAGIKWIICESPRRDPLEAYICFPPDVVPCALSFADFALCPFIVITGTSQVALVVKNLPINAGDIRDAGLTSGIQISWRRAWQPIPGFLPREQHGQGSLVGYSP